MHQGSYELLFIRKQFNKGTFKKLFLPAIFALFVFPVYSQSQQEADSILTKKRTFNGEDIIRGERLFFGLAYPEPKAVNCAGCHNTRVLDTLNWNPDALEISRKFLNKSAKDLYAVVMNPTGVMMSKVHKGFQLSPEDVVLLKAYIDRFVDIGLSKRKPVITNLFLFIVTSILLLFSIVDLIITKKIRRQWINLLIIAVTGTFITYTLVVEAIALGRSKNYSPFQPIKFSHAVHAGQNQTDCLYCHSSAPYSKTAGIPPVNVCMNCHLLVRNGTRSGTTEIAKIIDAYENIYPIKWIRVHNLPDHVFFSHAQHVGAGKVDCRECHGKVEEMNVIRQVSDLSMGWCLDCHRSRNVDFTGNKFYADYKELAGKIREGIVDSVTVVMLGGEECMKCHY